jgi:hypothetical protein
MKSRILMIAPALVGLFSAACSTEVSTTHSENTGSTAQALSCPSAGSNDDELRAAADTAHDILVAAANFCHVAGQNGNGVPDNQTDGCWSSTILASQRYRVKSDNSGIEFDPNDVNYSHVPNDAKVALAMAQLPGNVSSSGETMAQFYIKSLQWDRANTDGTAYPELVPVQIFAYAADNSTHMIFDTITGNHTLAQLSMQSPCSGILDNHILFYPSYSWDWDMTPMLSVSYGRFQSNRPAGYTGWRSTPQTPFNGYSTGNNPYLVIAVNGQNFDWNNPNSYNGANCGCTNAGYCSSCQATIDIDPALYTLAGPQTDNTGALLGPQPNPFNLLMTQQYAHPDHQQQYAKHVVGGNPHSGQFLNPINVLGSIVFQYVEEN